MSAASRNIDRLAAKGYVEKKKTDGNGKTVHLYLTEKGQNLADLHRAYDLEKTEKFARLLARKYSMEDLGKWNEMLKIIQQFYTMTDQEK